MRLKSCVIGHPVAHSKSPIIHQYWLEYLGITGQYDRILAPLDDFEKTVRNLISQGYLGANVTIPFKEAALKISDQATNLAKKTGAANTLVFKDGKIFADNTDGHGFGRNITEAYPDWDIAGWHLILGAGGAARAIMNWLLDHGAMEITIVNRNLDRAHALAAEHGRVHVASWDDLDHVVRDRCTIINTTSLGMSGQDDIRLDFSKIHPDTIINDIVYAPLVTGLLRDAMQNGLRHVGGLGMLIHQARPGFLAWFGQEPPEDDSELRERLLK